jgi:predicted transcriptional regulator
MQREQWRDLKKKKKKGKGKEAYLWWLTVLLAVVEVPITQLLVAEEVAELKRPRVPLLFFFSILVRFLLCLCWWWSCYR